MEFQEGWSQTPFFIVTVCVLVSKHASHKDLTGIHRDFTYTDDFEDFCERNQASLRSAALFGLHIRFLYRQFVVHCLTLRFDRTTAVFINLNAETAQKYLLVKLLKKNLVITLEISDSEKVI